MVKIAVKIYRNVIQEINNTIGDKCERETGGLLGVRNGIIDSFMFDLGLSNNSNTYIPNVSVMNETIYEWRKEDIFFSGIIHSHICNTYLSYADIEYARRILSINNLDGMNMFLYILSTLELRLYVVTNSQVVNAMIKIID